MNTTIKKVAGGIVALIVAFGIGRYSSRSSSVKIDTKTDTTKQTDTDTHKTTVITKDSSGKEVTTITEDTTTDTKRTTDTKTDSAVTPPKTSIINVSALAGLDTSRGFVPTYGVSVNREILGPLTIGAFGLTNGTIGLSLGVNF